MIFTPPRHGKSELVSRRFPAWVLGKNPDWQVISTSYNSEFAADFGRDVRNIVALPEYQRLFGVSLRPDSKAADRWHTNKDGMYVSAGVGSGITGRGAHLAIVDDPIKDWREALSSANREAIKDWYASTLYTRLMPGGAIIIVQTRWHKDDLSGWLLSEASRGGDRWTVLSLPAIAEPGDRLGRSPGGPLWPAWYPLHTLERIRVVTGSDKWAALYQQRPVEEEGNLFKRNWWKIYRQIPEFEKIIQSWDTAHESGKDNDYSVCTTWGVFRNELYLLDLYRGRPTFPELRRAAMLMALKHSPHVVLIEGMASGKPLIQDLKAETGIPIVEIRPLGDKLARANAVTGMIEAGRVYVPEWGPWKDEVIAEMADFPKGEHDDIVDSAVQALTYLRPALTASGFTADEARKLAAKWVRL